MQDLYDVITRRSHGKEAKFGATVFSVHLPTDQHHKSQQGWFDLFVSSYENEQIMISLINSYYLLAFISTIIV